jgi:hypothetical protein
LVYKRLQEEELAQRKAYGEQKAKEAATKESVKPSEWEAHFGAEHRFPRPPVKEPPIPKPRPPLPKQKDPPVPNIGNLKPTPPKEPPRYKPAPDEVPRWKEPPPFKQPPQQRTTSWYGS